MSNVREGSVVDGRYRVERRIGSGGMADVWLADDLHLPRRVALKVLHAHFARDPEFIERFRREAESAAALQHTNIVPIFDRGQVEDTYYIAMAYLDGSTLRELINIGLTPVESVAIVRQILEAAGFAHSHGVIHRDLKPLNVIVDSSGKATVTDFGIARAGASDMTEAGSVMGTASYLSPEQAQGVEVGPESDLYSVGVVLYECLSGRVPFEGETAVAVALRQATEDPLPPSAYNPSVSPALDAVVMRALARNPVNRFPDAYTFIDALDQAMAHPDVVYVEPEKKKIWPWLLAVLFVVLLALAIIGLTRSNTVDVPDVTGNRLDTAISLLRDDGYSVSEVKHVNRPVQRDVVLEQNPSGETDRDCALLGWFCSKPDVQLTVSDGPGKTEVPDVSGDPADEAQQTLEDAGFDVTATDQSSADVEAGIVIDTDPAAGESVQAGSEITMYVSSGVKQVAVPPLVGLTLGAAAQRIAAKGLEYNSTEEESDRPAGEVISQSPDAGTKVDPGSTIEMVVSSGQPDTSVTVPSVVGKTQSEAESMLTGLGLVVTVQDQDTTIEPQDGRVIDQSPDSGTSLPAGSQIVITVGNYTPDTGPTDSTGGITP
mgnify:CR=1 FL=1